MESKSQHEHSRVDPSSARATYLPGKSLMILVTGAEGFIGGYLVADSEYGIAVCQMGSVARTI
jgi:hypothetical protein